MRERMIQNQYPFRSVASRLVDASLPINVSTRQAFASEEVFQKHSQHLTLLGLLPGEELLFLLGIPLESLFGLELARTLTRSIAIQKVHDVDMHPSQNLVNPISANLFLIQAHKQSFGSVILLPCTCSQK